MRVVGWIGICTGVEFGYQYMPNIVRDFWIEFHKTTIVSQCHKHNKHRFTTTYCASNYFIPDQCFILKLFPKTLYQFVKFVFYEIYFT